MPKDYFNLLIWEKWFLISLMIVIIISFLIISIVEVFLRYSKYRKYKKSLEGLQKKSAVWIFLAIILLALMPIIFIIVNKLGFLKGFLFFLAIILTIISFIMICFHKLSFKKQNKDRKRHLIFWFTLAMISLIFVCFIAGEADYKSRLATKNKRHNN